MRQRNPTILLKKSSEILPPIHWEREIHHLTFGAVAMPTRICREHGNKRRSDHVALTYWGRCATVRSIMYIRVSTMKERNGISTLPSVRICLLPSSFEMTSWNPATFSIPFPREVFLLDYANWIKVHFELPKIHTIYVLVKCMIVFCNNFMPRWWIMIIDSLLHDLRHDCLLVCLLTFIRLALIELVVAKKRHYIQYIGDDYKIF